MREIEFTSDFEIEPEVHKIEEIDPQKDLGVETIEQLPDIKSEEQIEFTLKKKKEAARERLAIVFVIGLFIVILVGMVLAYLGDETKVQNITQTIVSISGVLTGPLGFIIGYYFRKQEEEE